MSCRWGRALSSSRTWIGEREKNRTSMVLSREKITSQGPSFYCMGTAEPDSVLTVPQPSWQRQQTPHDHTQYAAGDGTDYSLAVGHSALPASELRNEHRLRLSARRREPSTQNPAAAWEDRRTRDNRKHRSAPTMYQQKSGDSTRL